MSFLKHCDTVLGIIDLENLRTGTAETGDTVIDELVAAREEARKNRDFSAADAIRDELASRGIAIEDTPQGARWKRVLP